MKSDSIKEIATALHKFQAKLEPPRKNKVNPFFKSNYADLEACWDSVRDNLHEFGLSVTHLGALAPGTNAPVLVTRLMHVSGEWIDSVMPLNPVQQNVGSKDKPVFATTPQTLASAITYSRRYGLCSILGITPTDDDDDGNAASRPANKEDLFV